MMVHRQVASIEVCRYEEGLERLLQPFSISSLPYVFSSPKLSPMGIAVFASQAMAQPQSFVC